MVEAARDQQQANQDPSASIKLPGSEKLLIDWFREVCEANKGRAIHKWPIVPTAPPLPASIEDIDDSALKREAAILWRKSWVLRGVVNGQLNWYQGLLETGDANLVELLNLLEQKDTCLMALAKYIEKLHPEALDQADVVMPGLRVGWQPLALWQYYDCDYASGLHGLYGEATNIIKLLEDEDDAIVLLTIWPNVNTSVQQPGKIHSSSGKRTDEPTDADLLIGRTVLTEMATNKPSVEAFRKAVRDKGLKVSNARIGKMLKLIQGEQLQKKSSSRRPHGDGRVSEACQ